MFFSDGMVCRSLFTSSMNYMIRLSHYKQSFPFLVAAPPSYAESVSGQTRRYDTVHFDKGMGMPQLSATVKKTS